MGQGHRGDDRAACVVGPIDGRRRACASRIKIVVGKDAGLRAQASQRGVVHDKIRLRGATAIGAADGERILRRVHSQACRGSSTHVFAPVLVERIGPTDRISMMEDAAARSVRAPCNPGGDLRQSARGRFRRRCLGVREVPGLDPGRRQCGAEKSHRAATRFGRKRFVLPAASIVSRIIYNFQPLAIGSVLDCFVRGARVRKHEPVMRPVIWDAETSRWRFLAGGQCAEEQ